MKRRMKRKRLFRPGRLFTAAALAACVLASAQSVTDSRSERASFKASLETTLEVENKYGTILIVPWNKDSVQVTADVFLEAKNSSRLRKLKNDVRISFTGNSTYILARTIIGDGSSRVAAELRTLSNTLGAKSSVEINYTIYLPDYINLVLTNKYGDIYIDDLSGDVDIDLSNGALKANSFSGSSDITLLFAKGSIRNMGTASLDLSYAELDVNNVNQLDLISKSSELQIDTAGVIKIESRRDKLRFGEVEYLYGNSNFTDISINDFIREADCELKYGSLSIDKVLPDFTNILLESDYTDITLYFSQNSAYQLNIVYNEKAIVRLPERNADLVTRQRGEDYRLVEGRVGQADTSKRLKIRADHKCYINVSTR